MMPIGKRRTKLVSFRLSEEEYEAFQATCIGEGARSMSEFARATLRQRITNSLKPSASNAAANGATTAAANMVDGTLELTTQELVETTRELTLLLTRLITQIRGRSTDLSS